MQALREYPPQLPPDWSGLTQPRVSSVPPQPQNFGARLHVVRADHTMGQKDVHVRNGDWLQLNLQVAAAGDYWRIECAKCTGTGADPQAAERMLLALRNELRAVPSKKRQEALITIAEDCCKDVEHPLVLDIDLQFHSSEVSTQPQPCTTVRVHIATVTHKQFEPPRPPAASPTASSVRPPLPAPSPVPRA